MTEKTMVEKAGEAVGFGIAMAEDVAGAVKTAVGAAVTTLTEVLKKPPATKAPVKRIAKTTPAKKASATKVVKKPATKTASKKATAVRPSKAASAKKTAAKKAVKKAAQRPK